LAIIAMGSAETSVEPSLSPTGATLSPTEKNVRTNVTRSPEVVSPGGGNGAVPCGFGPAGGGPCTRHH
jgi:hypothetical protein